MINGNVTLKVTPEDLQAKASSVAKKLGDMQKTWESMNTTILATDSFWIGEAGNLHRDMYKKQQENIETIMRRLNEHPKDLNDIAATYLGVEKAVQEIAQSLETGILE